MEVNKTNQDQIYLHSTNMALWRKNLYTKIHLSFGYGEIYEKSTQNQKLFHCFNVFPNAVKEAFSFTTSADYEHDKLKSQCED